MSEVRFAGLALDTAVAATLVTGLLFVAGWGYAEQWFGLFDMGVIGLGIPPGNFAIYGFWTLESRAWWLVGLVLLFAAMPLLRPALGRPLGRVLPPRWRPRTQTHAVLTGVLRGLLPLLLFGVFAGAYLLGRQAASAGFERHAAARFCAFPFVRVVLKGPERWPEALPDLRVPLAAGQYRLLIQSGGVLALFRVPPPVTEHLPPLPGLVIPIGEVSLLELDPVRPECRPG